MVEKNLICWQFLIEYMGKMVKSKILVHSLNVIKL
ncbi:hypothetical protein LINPERHAP2_LOCUS22992 [Linum perenne]